MSIYVSEKDIQEKILLNNSIPRNVKDCQRLYRVYKKISTLYHEKKCQRDTRKIVSVLVPVMEFHVERKRINSIRRRGFR